MTAISDAVTETDNSAIPPVLQIKEYKGIRSSNPELREDGLVEAVTQYLKTKQIAEGLRDAGNDFASAMFLERAAVIATEANLYIKVMKEPVHVLAETAESRKKLEEHLGSIGSIARRHPTADAKTIRELESKAYYGAVDIALDLNMPTAHIFGIISRMAERFPERSETEIAGEFAYRAGELGKYAHMADLAQHYELGKDKFKYADHRARPRKRMHLGLSTVKEATATFVSLGRQQDALFAMIEIDSLWKKRVYGDENVYDMQNIPTQRPIVYNMQNIATQHSIEEIVKIIKSATSAEEMKRLLEFAQAESTLRGEHIQAKAIARELKEELSHDGPKSETKTAEKSTLEDRRLSDEEKTARAAERLERSVRAPERNRIVMAMRREAYNDRALPHQRTPLSLEEHEILAIVVRDATLVPPHHAKLTAEVRPKPPEVHIDRAEFRSDLDALVSRGDLQRSGTRYRLKV